jgi:N-formylglutamate amidohydrolase
VKPFAKLHSENLVMRCEGNCPLILSCPHGGSVKLTDFNIRKGNNSLEVITKRDDYTLRVAEGVFNYFRNEAKLTPYVVAANFHRAYIDANRGLTHLPYADPRCKVYYDEYHLVLKSFIKDIGKRFGTAVLLIDIHGAKKQKGHKAQIFIGTDDENTTPCLIKRVPEGIWAKDGFSDRLASRIEIGVLPKFRGGHIVRSYGCQSLNVDAIQLELTPELRNPGLMRKRACRAIGRAILCLMAPA